ncbi:MAG: hypothetical protein SGPRY_014761, partial [Prymnesium sp.]
MVSMFLSELKGVLKCSRQQMTDYLAKHPKLHMAAELMADPNWSGISTLMLEPGAAPGKHKYFDAEQLNEQSKLAMDIFDATHVAPGRWCKALFFFDHSSGHGAYSTDALVAQRENKGPDWKGTIAPIRDGWFRDANGLKQVQRIQFAQGDKLARDIVVPSDAFKMFCAGALVTIKKHNTGKSADEIQSIARARWEGFSADKRMGYVRKVRAKAAAGPAQTPADRLLKAGSLVPKGLWGRSKGLVLILWSGRASTLQLGSRARVAQLNSTTIQTTAVAPGSLLCSRIFKWSARRCSIQRTKMERTFEPMPRMSNTVQTSRHLCIFLPKVREKSVALLSGPSLIPPVLACTISLRVNWIERSWGASKQYTRRHCLYTLAGLRETVPLSLTQDLDELPEHLRNNEDLPVLPLFKQRRHARISRQFMREYLKGSDACDALKAIQEQRSTRHRDNSDSRSRQIEVHMAMLAF